MGNTVKSFATGVAKAAISGAGSAIPVIGGPLASWINSKFAVGASELLPPGGIPSDRDTKVVKSPAQLKALIKQYPVQAAKAGLTADMVDEKVAEMKADKKCCGGKVKKRSPAQQRATAKMLAAKKKGK
jgi:hypothetical protein